MKIDLLVDLRGDSIRTPLSERLPAIERCVARGDAITFTGESLTACLLGDYGLQPNAAPIAALSLIGEGDTPGNEYWLRADPITFQPTRHRVAGGLLPDGALDWSEARARAEILAPHLRTEGCELILKHPQRWYLRCSSPQELVTVAPPPEIRVLDEDLLPSGPDGARWRRLMTEAQMLFFTAELDQEREAAGRPAANGIWVWGGGTTPRLERRPYAVVYSNDVLARGLAQCSEAKVFDLPDAVATIAAEVESDPARQVLIALSQSSAPDLPTLDKLWVAPLVALIMQGHASEMRLRMLAANRHWGYHITRSHLRRWWRRSRPLLHHA